MCPFMRETVQEKTRRAAFVDEYAFYKQAWVKRESLVFAFCMFFVNLQPSMVCEHTAIAIILSQII